MNQTDIDYFSKKQHGQNHKTNKKRGGNGCKYQSRSYATYNCNGSERGWRRKEDRQSHHSRRGITRYLISRNLLESETMVGKTSARGNKNGWGKDFENKKIFSVKF